MSSKGRGRTPTKERKTETVVEAAPAAAAPAVERRRSTNTSSSSAAAADASKTRGIDIWAIVGAVVFAWAAYDWNARRSADGYSLSLKSEATKLGVRAFITYLLTYTFLSFQQDWTKGKSWTAWYLALRTNYAFSANVFEAAVIMFTSKYLQHLYKHKPNDFSPQSWLSFPQKAFVADLNWTDIKVGMMIASFYVTPILTWFNIQMDKHWKWGGKWGSLVFNQFVFSPIFNTLLFVFADYCTQMFTDKEGLNFFLQLPCFGSTWKVAHAKLFEISTASVFGFKFPFRFGQLISWTYWVPITWIQLNKIPAEYVLLFGSLAGLVWNIVFDTIINGAK